MGKAEKMLAQMKSNPKADRTPDNVKTLCKAFNIKVRQQGTSHAVLTNGKGAHLTIPMHKPIKPLYIKRLTQMIEVDREF